MPEVLAGILVQLGVSALAATIISTAVFIAAGLLFLGGGGVKPDQAERTLRSPKPPRCWIIGRRRSYGAQMLFTNTADGSTVDVWAFCEGPINAVVQAYLNDDKITVTGGVVQQLADGSYEGGYVHAGWNYGATPEVAHAAVVSAVPDWTSSHRGDGICSGYLIKQPVKAKKFLNVYPQGDNVSMSLAIEGSPMHDPREPSSDPDDPTTWPYRDNAALAHMWFRMVIKGDSYAEKFAPTEQMWIDAADDCDELYSLSAGGTEPKYRTAIMFDASAEPAAIEDEFRACYDGWTAPDEQGALRVFSGKLYTPTLTLDENDIIDYSLAEGIEEENRVNEIIVRYISAPHDYLEEECDPWRDEDDILARGKVYSATADLQVPSHTQGRRLAKRKMARVNAPQRGSLRVKHSARGALLERYVTINLVEAGVTLFEGDIEVIGGERDYETGGASIEWIAVDPNVDNWNAATEDGQPAPTGSKTYLDPLDPPTIDSAIGILAEDGTFAQITITVSGPESDALTWFARWKRESNTVWNEAEYSDIDAGPSVVLQTGSVPFDGPIEVEAAYQMGDGRVSDWSESVSVVTEIVTADADIYTADATTFTADRG